MCATWNAIGPEASGAPSEVRNQTKGVLADQLSEDGRRLAPGAVAFGLWSGTGLVPHPVFKTGTPS